MIIKLTSQIDKHLAFQPVILAYGRVPCFKPAKAGPRVITK